MVNIDLSGKAVLMTGGLGAIAEHIVRRLVTAGASLILVDIKSREVAQKTLDEWHIPRSAYVYFEADLTDAGAVAEVTRRCFDTFAVSTALGHAGGCSLHPFSTTSKEEYERIYRLNYLAQTYVARSILREWTTRRIAGHLIFTSSYVARMPHTNVSSYAAAKAALETFARCLALEYASTGIRVNVVSPGNVAAGSSLKVYQQEDKYRKFVNHISLNGRQNSPEAVADVFLFMCSELARELNGQVVNVDLGIGIGYRLET